jgi:hypothetical protein
MLPEVQAGTILIKKSPLMAQLLGLESEPCFGNWSQVKVLDGFVLDREIHAAGWHIFFMGAEIKVMFLGSLGAKKIQNSLRRILGKVSGHDFNCLEVTGIVVKRFLGIPYTTVSAHWRHIQPSHVLQ